MHMPEPLSWNPASLPRPVTLRGRTVHLEPLDAAKHSAALWAGVEGHDDLWTWLFEGPFPDAASLRGDIEKKQAAADRCPRSLGTFVKPPEVQYHHEVYNQFLWNMF